MTRRRQQQEQAPIDDLIDAVFHISSRHPPVGFVIAGIFAIAGSVFFFAGPKTFFGIGALLGVCIYFAAGAVLLVSVLALLKLRFGRGAPAAMLDSFAPGVPRGAGDSNHHNLSNVRLPYVRKTRLLSRGEFAFYDVLRHVVGDTYSIFCKVRLSDLVTLPNTTPNRNFWNGKASQKHVDFVLCHPATLEPILVIELDDRSHDSARAAKSDEFKDQVFQQTGLQIYRVRCQAAYDVRELAAQIRRHEGDAVLHPA